MTKTSTNQDTSDVFGTLYVDQIYGVGGGNITVNGGMNIKGDIIPDMTETYRIGDSTHRFQSVSSTFNYLEKFNIGTSFTGANIASIPAATDTQAPLTITNTPFAGPSNSFQFQQKGYYMMSLDITHDSGGLSNRLFVYLKLVSPPTYQSRETYDTALLAYKKATFGFWVDNIADNFEIWYRSNSGLSNVEIVYGRLMLCSSYE